MSYNNRYRWTNKEYLRDKYKKYYPEYQSTTQKKDTLPIYRYTNINIEDLNKYAIPIGYDTTHYKKGRKPVILHGTVFNYQSLANWIYMWTKYTEPKDTNILKTAKELQYYLILFTDKLDLEQQILNNINTRR